MDKFWAKVEKTAGCWIWRGALDNYGYGNQHLNAKDSGTGKPRWTKAHRVSWFLEHGQWPHLYVLHHCDNPCCVRPDHLFLGTQADNMRDLMVKGRHRNSVKKRCLRGHEFTADNTYSYIWRGSEHRACKACRRSYVRKAA